MSGFYMVCLNKDNKRELMGTDNQMIIDDLKTLKGVLRRIDRYNLNHSKPFRVYRYTGHFLDRRNNMKLVYEKV